MPSQPSPSKRMISIRVPRTLYLRLTKQARQHRESMADYLRDCLQNITEDIELTPQEQEQIAHETREAIHYRSQGKAKKKGDNLCLCESA